MKNKEYLKKVREILGASKAECPPLGQMLANSKHKKLAEQYNAEDITYIVEDDKPDTMWREHDQAGYLRALDEKAERAVSEILEC